MLAKVKVQALGSEGEALLMPPNIDSHLEG